MARYFSNDGTVSAVPYGKDGDKVLFDVAYDDLWYTTKLEAHEIKLYEWAKHLHGNAPAGTPYGYFRASRNGKRIVITV